MRLTSPTADFVPYLAENLKEWDKKEVGLVFPNWPVEAVIQYSINHSEIVHYAEADGKPIAISGYGDDCGWMLSTPEIKNHKKTFLKLSHQMLSEYAQFGDYIYNEIHKENKTTIRWLKRLGFKVSDLKPNGFLTMGRELCGNT
jgi:hypothetical protein